MSGDRRLTAVEIVNGEKTGQTRVLEAEAQFQLHRHSAADGLVAQGDRSRRQGVPTHRAGPRPITDPGARSGSLICSKLAAPGVFAAGDVRPSGSVKRVASAVGEGAMAVQFVHEYLKEM